MDAATIIVLVLSAGVIALLAWFEINSRRNEANMESKSALAQSETVTLKKKSQSAVEPDTQKIRPA